MKVRCLFLTVIVTLLVIFIPLEAKAEMVLMNAGFEADSQDPWYWWGEAGTGTYGVTEYAHSGAKSVRIIVDGGDYIPMGFLQDFECSPGIRVTIKAWVMSPETNPLTNSNAFIKLEFWGEDPYNPIETMESEHLTGAFDWENVTVSAETPQGTTKVKIGLFIWNPGTDHSGAVYFDDASASR